MQLFIMFGSDGGGVIIGPDGKPHPVPPWEARLAAEVSIAVNILKEAARLKTPGLSTSVTQTLGRFVHKELAGRLENGQTGIAVVA